MFQRISQNSSNRIWLTVLVGAIGGSAAASLLLHTARGRESELADSTGSSGANELDPVIQLKRLGKAMHEFHGKFGHFPAAAVVGPDGETLHSWRVALLPMLGYQDLYDEYRLNEPWDSEHNRSLIPKMPSVYRRANEQQGPTYTRWSAIIGPKTVFHGNLGTRIRSIKDGTSNTMMLIESENPIPWTRPEDVEVPRPDPTETNADGFYALLADGSPVFVSRTTPRAIIEAYSTATGGEFVDYEEARRHLKFYWAP